MNRVWEHVSAIRILASTSWRCQPVLARIPARLNGLGPSSPVNLVKRLSRRRGGASDCRSGERVRYYAGVGGQDTRCGTAEARAAQEHLAAATLAVQLTHAKNKSAGRFILFLVLSFWDKNTEIICASAMPCAHGICARI